MLKLTKISNMTLKRNSENSPIQSVFAEEKKK